MLLPLWVVLAVAPPEPIPIGLAAPVVTAQSQDPAKAKPAPKQSPKQASPPKPSGGAQPKPSAGQSGTARPQPPRGNPGGAPKATGEPRLKRRGT